jgi:hypothetical protein
LALAEDPTHYFADFADTSRDLAVVRLAEDAPPSIRRYPTKGLILVHPFC